VTGSEALPPAWLTQEQ